MPLPRLLVHSKIGGCLLCLLEMHFLLNAWVSSRRHPIKLAKIPTNTPGLTVKIVNWTECSSLRGSLQPQLIFSIKHFCESQNLR